MIISDTQEPYTVDGAIRFCKKVQKEFKIPKENIIHVGDEVDQYWASRFPKDPDAIITARGELKIAREKMKEWYAAFPICDVAISNHGIRWLARAHDAYIPSEILRPYRELLEAPSGWRWHEEIRVKTKTPFRVIHGVGYSGINGHRNACIDAGISTAIGHLHSHAGVSHVCNGKKTIWGMNVGCLMDPEPTLANGYAKYSRHKGVLSCGVVIDDGLTPIVVPYEKL